MSTTKTTKTADDRVEVNIQRGGDREDPNLFVAVNGVNYLLPRGKKSRVPKAVADEIARAVSEEFGTGLTIIDAHGFYSDTPKTVLYVVVNRFQTVKLKTLVKGVDANAYMAISPVADLLHGSKEEETA